ncbi:hypothetical protein PUMCH_003753 [Australozyma saopauloensis]|uniref:Actin-like protein ARP6 n=1 Tax=Australozyma saopauloensis TaxID=291208 RepID=A0AAX4HF41_9ASCO|nr:hypothetical protein PUMCH_003753 [[Candida] saopauloensis]
MTKKHLVLDNGSYSIKAGFSTDESPCVVQNLLAKAKDGVVYIGNDYLKHTNLYSGINFRRPHDQGHLTSWETEKPVWDYTFDQVSPLCELDPLDTRLLLTEIPFQLPRLSMNTDLIVFEEYGFSEYYRCPAPLLVPWDVEGKPQDFTLVIDCGYNSIHVVPVLYQRVYWKGIRKLPIGGRHLNGLLKETISFRHYDVSDEPILINTVREQTMFVASDFEEALKNKASAKCEFILPDFKTTFTGYVRDGSTKPPADAQSIQLFDERFTIPESFFKPEIMLDHNLYSKNPIVQKAHFKNLTDLVVESIMACPDIIRPVLLENINVVGGTAKLDNLTERLISELKRELPVNWNVKLTDQTHDVSEVAWYGGKRLIEEDIMRKLTITKQDFFEHGENWCQKQFGFENF